MSSTAKTKAVHHISPISTYLKVFGALIFLTYMTVQVSVWNLGPNSIYIALMIAVVKASLVAAFFMHLKYDTRFNLLVMFSSVLFMGLFFALIFVDVQSRGWLNPEEGNFVLQNERSILKSEGSAPVR